MRKLVLSIASIALLVGALIWYFVAASNSDNGLKAAVSSIEINEVMTSNKGSVPDEYGDYPDYVELHNTSNEVVSLAGYGLTDDFMQGAKYMFPAGVTIEPNGFKVVFLSGEASDDYHAPFKIGVGETLLLYDIQGATVGELALKAVASGMTMSKNPDTGEWVEMAPSPGFPNTPEGILAFEEGQKAVEDIGVYINELMASNSTTIIDKYGVASDWIELYNSTDAEVDLSGFGISDSSSQPMKYSLPEGTKIAPHGYLLIFCSGNTSQAGDEEIHVPFGLRAYQEEVVLANKRGAIVDQTAFSKLASDVSWARLPDGTGDFAISTLPTPGFANNEAGYAAYSASVSAALPDVYISEILGRNVAAKTAPDGGTYDYIELHNKGEEAVSLLGWALSNNPKNPAKWEFGDIVIAPGEYFLVYASGLDRRTDKNDLHTNFGVSSSGDAVYLFNGEALVDKLAASAFMNDVSCGRLEDGAVRYFELATPGAANGEGKLGITATPAFSQTPGVFSQPISLELTANEGETVYYTLDCTEPTAASSVYTQPLKIEKNTVVRCVSVRDGYITNYHTTGTFLFTSDNVNHSLPIATIVTDPVNLWDATIGIYAMGNDVKEGDQWPYFQANYYRYKADPLNRDWERDGAFSIFGDDNKAVFSQNVAVRIAGSFGSGHNQKGMTVVARDIYGNNRLEYPFFGERGYSEYKSLTFRAGGQDQANGKIRDELSAGLLMDTDVNFVYQEYKPYILYLNGEYWGLYFMKEKRSRFLVAAEEDAAPSDIDLIRSEDKAFAGTTEGWREIMSYVRANGASTDTAYAWIDERVDLNSFIDYMVCEIYVGNSDYWNIQYYKAGDGKWKWIYYDFCWTWGDPTHTTLTYRRASKNPCSDFFNALLKNEKWKDAFCRRMAELMNTIYTEENVNKKVDELYAIVKGEIAREREKFNQATFMGISNPKSQASVESFEKQIERIRTFAQKRPAQIRAQFKSELSLSDAYMKEVFGE